MGVARAVRIYRKSYFAVSRRPTRLRLKSYSHGEMGDPFPGPDSPYDALRAVNIDNTLTNTRSGSAGHAGVLTMPTSMATTSRRVIRRAATGRLRDTDTMNRPTIAETWTANRVSLIYCQLRGLPFYTGGSQCQSN